MNSFLIILAVLVVAYLLFGRSGGNVPSISQGEIKDLRAKHPKLQFLDVRTPSEIASGKMKGAKEINFMSPNFKQQLERLPKDRPYVVYCRSGRRSASACSVMQQMGFTEVYNLRGGYAG